MYYILMRSKSCDSSILIQWYVLVRPLSVVLSHLVGHFWTLVRLLRSGWDCWHAYACHWLVATMFHRSWLFFLFNFTKMYLALDEINHWRMITTFLLKWIHSWLFSRIYNLAKMFNLFSLTGHPKIIPGLQIFFS